MRAEYLIVLLMLAVPAGLMWWLDTRAERARVRRLRSNRADLRRALGRRL